MYLFKVLIDASSIYVIKLFFNYILNADNAND